MCSGSHTWRVLALSVAFGLACGAGSDAVVDPAPAVEAVEPACGSSSTVTPVVVRGSLPVNAVISISDPARNRLDTRYLAWIGAFELTQVTWTSARELTAVVPSGIPAGIYGLTVEGPSGARGTKDAAFEVREGPCPVPTVALVITTPLATPATTVVGREVTVTATVQNDGQASALAVTASILSAPAGLTLLRGPPGPQDVPGGQARTYTWVFTASAPGGGVFVIDAAGTAADTGLLVTAARVSTNGILVNPGLFLTGSTMVAPAQATVGQLVTVALTATNHSSSAVLVSPTIAVTGPVTAGSAPTVQSIPEGSARVFQWTFAANAPGTATFTASVSGTDPATGALVTVPTAPASVTVQSAPGLSATLSIPPTVELGDFPVTMRVSNSGAATAAAVADVVPDPPSAQAGSTAGVVLKSGPAGTPALVIAGEPAVTITWVFTATTPGTLVLTSVARGTDANTGTPVASAPAGSSPASVGLHTVGGTVSGLAGKGLVLRNGGENLPVGANGAYTFPTRVPTGGTYNVTVAAQPRDPDQKCTVANRSGTIAAADVSDVNVTCPARR